VNVSAWLADAQSHLVSAGITTARLDCLVLLEDAIGKDRSWLLSHPEYELQGSEIEILHTKVVQRAKHIPLAYLRGHAEFYGREFAVSEHTLVLRGLAADGKLPAEPRILDIGTGSGCIAITAALELPQAHVSACDIDKKCLQMAAQNAAALGAHVQFFASDLLDSAEPSNHAESGGTSMSYDILLANLPYVPDNFQINTAATHEPRHALFGGPDGLDLYRRLFAQTTMQDKQSSVEAKPLYILAESLPPQHESLAHIVKAAGYRLQQTDDFIQLFARI
jgi:release factor glutamine methyltransferase